MARMGAVIVVFVSLLISVFLVEAGEVVIRRVCSATRYPLSCEEAFLHPQWKNASSKGLLEGMTAIATGRTWGAVADVKVLATRFAPSANNKNVTFLASGCAESLGLASYNVENAHGTFGTRDWRTRSSTTALEDIQAWLSGALVQSTDCYYSLTRFPLTASSSTNASALAYVATIANRMNVTVELISNALALADARLEFGSNSSLWQPPPESRAEQLQRLTIALKKHPSWKTTQSGGSIKWAKLEANVTVALDSAAFSIQAAVDNAPSWSPTRYVIYIRAGVYKEIVRVPKDKINLTFLGDGSNVTVITGSLSQGTPGITTWSSATVGVSGAGFMAKGITFENTAGPVQHQAVALRVESDRSVFLECAIMGHQDSLYTHSMRQFYKDCTIAGTVDFIFGNSAAIFQTCNLLVRVRTDATATSSSTSTLTAQGRTDPGQNTALVFHNCMVDGTEAYKALYKSNPARHQVYLGRPWKTYSRTIFLHAYLSQIVTPQGWMAWNGTYALDTLLDAEYGSYGPGAANLTERISWSTQLSLLQTQGFSPERLLQINSWLPPTAVAHSP